MSTISSAQKCTCKEPVLVAPDPLQALRCAVCGKVVEPVTVECDACGKKFLAESGYFEPGEYAYCDDSCHW